MSDPANNPTAGGPPAALGVVSPTTPTPVGDVAVPGQTSDTKSDNSPGGAALSPTHSEHHDQKLAVEASTYQKLTGEPLKDDADSTPRPSHDGRMTATPGIADRTIQVVSYHSDSDLYIHHDSDGVVMCYKVCSALVAAASPTLKNISSNKRFLDAADLGAGARTHGLDIVLSIIHFKFHDIPSNLSVDQLYGISRVVETCGCSHLLAPFVPEWVVGLKRHITKDTEQKDADKTLYVSWVLGDASGFARTLSTVAQQATLNDTGVLLNTHGQPWQDQGPPPVVVDLIARARNECLIKIVQTIDEPLRELLEDGEAATKYCRSKDSEEGLKQSCRHLQLGSLMTTLTTAKLLPFPTVEHWRQSAASLADKLKAVKVDRFKMPGIVAHKDSHIHCGIHHHDAIEQALNERVTLTPWVVRELSVRAHKSGVFPVVAKVYWEANKMNEATVIPESVMEELRLDPVHFKQVVKESHPLDHRLMKDIGPALGMI